MVFAFVSQIATAQDKPKGCGEIPVIGQDGATTLSTDLPNPLPSVFRFKGTLRVIGNGFTLSGATIKMDPGAKVYVDLFLQLTDGTILEGCTTMWKGVELDHHATIIVDSNSEINDAEYAIDIPLHNCSVFLQSGAKFNRNYTAMRVRFGQFLPFSLDCHDFTVSGSGPFLPPYTGQPSGTTVNRAQYGFYFRNVFSFDEGIVQVGDNGNEMGNFTDCDFGVYSESSLIRVEHCNFYDFPPNSTSLDANCIYALESGIMRVHNNTFANAMTGVYLNGLRYTVWENNMENMYRGVYATNSQLNFLPLELPTIEGNVISETNYGISSFYNGHSNVHIIGNQIFMASIHAIEMIDNPLTSHLGYVHNNLTTTEGGHGYFFPTNGAERVGIYINGLEDVAVCKNTMLMGTDSEGKDAGIVVLGSGGHTITNNTITSVPNMINTFGTVFSNMDYTRVHCNRLNFTHSGATFGNACSNTSVETNRFNQHDGVGLWYWGGTVVGPQTHAGNLWAYPNGPTNPGAAELGINALANRYTVDNVENPSFLPFVSGQTSWFLPMPTPPLTKACNPSPSQICTTPPPEPDPMSPGSSAESRNGFDEDEWALSSWIAAGGVQLSQYNDQTRWALKRQLYQWIRENNAASTAEMASFLANDENSRANRFEDFVLSAENALAQSRPQQEELQTVWAQINVLLMENPFTDSHAAQLKTLLDDVSAKQQAYTAQKTQAVNQVKSLNNQLPDDTDFVSNEQALNEYALRYQDQQNFDFLTETDIALLRSIAAQCPFEGGKAVFYARGILGEVRGDLFDYIGDCPTYREDWQSNITEVESLEVFPNPSKGDFLVNIPAKSISNIQLYSLFGKLLVESTGNTMSVSDNFSNGTYLLVAQDTEGVSYQTKVILLR